MSYKEVYEELSLLGEGGMGKVYLVRHRRLGVLRAMKVVRKDDDQIARRGGYTEKP